MCSEEVNQFVDGEIGLAQDVAQGATLDVTGMIRDHNAQCGLFLVLQDVVAAARVVNEEPAALQRPDQAPP
jgi:hypothetical protein